MIIVSKACGCFSRRTLFAQRQRQQLSALINVAKKHLAAIAAGIGALPALFIACQALRASVAEPAGKIAPMPATRISQIRVARSWPTLKSPQYRSLERLGHTANC